MKTNLLEQKQIVKKLLSIIDKMDKTGNIYLADALTTCMEHMFKENIKKATVELRQIADILDKNGEYEIADNIDELLPKILEFKKFSKCSTKHRYKISAEKAYKMAKLLKQKYLVGIIDENNFEYSKMKEFENILKSGFILTSAISPPREFKNWWDYFNKGEQK